MNIKIKEPMPEHLVKEAYLVGSRSYGTERDDSDYDYVIFLKCKTGQLRLQYQNSNCDYMYICDESFYLDIKFGSSPLFFEVLHNEDFIRNRSKNKQKIIDDFYNKAMTKCYLGFAKRDLEYPDRIFHVNRCIWMAGKIIDKSWIDLKETQNIYVDLDRAKLKEKIIKMRKKLYE